MRLIDADCLKSEIQRRRKRYKTLTGVDMAMLVDDAPTVGGWISVKDRLPKVETEVLLVFPHNMAVGCINSRGYWKVNSGDDWYTFVADEETEPTHWMPLPEPPKEVSEDADD